MGDRVKKVMTQPINILFRALQNVRVGWRAVPLAGLRALSVCVLCCFWLLPQKTRIQIWLYEKTDLRIEGRIIGFDEYMNFVLDDAEELNAKKGGARKPLGAVVGAWCVCCVRWWG